jgi:hypothetical protein
LEGLQAQKEAAIEKLLEEIAEEKFEQQQQVKQKYSKMIGLLKNAANKDEKIAAQEEKKRVELEEIAEEFTLKKREGLAQIKE